MPFNDIVTAYSMDKINTDSVTVECNNNQCQSIRIEAPFGKFQLTSYNFIENSAEGFVFDWSSCGWDFQGGGQEEDKYFAPWNYPSRDFNCDNYDEVNGIVMYFLQNQGADVIITNGNMWGDPINCTQNKHCIIYSMDTNPSEIHCPTDAASFCYVIAMLPDLAYSIIDGTKSRHLLIKGYDDLGILHFL